MITVGADNDNGALLGFGVDGCQPVIDLTKCYIECHKQICLGTPTLFFDFSISSARLNTIRKMDRLLRKKACVE